MAPILNNLHKKFKTVTESIDYSHMPFALSISDMQGDPVSGENWKMQRKATLNLDDQEIDKSWTELQYVLVEQLLIDGLTLIEMDCPEAN